MKNVVPGRKGGHGVGGDLPMRRWTHEIEDTLGITVHEAVGLAASQVFWVDLYVRELLHEEVFISATHVTELGW